MSKNRPSDFGSFWYTVGKELAEIPVAPEVESIPMRSTDFADLYGVRLSSIGPYRLFGYLSIPKGDGPFPVIYYVPKNASVLEIIPQGTSNEIRRRYITFSLACRGMRNSDSPYAAMYPGQLTDGLESHETYVYRSIVADTVRGADYIMTRPEVDKNRVAAWGNDNAILAAALHDSITHIVSTPAYLFDPIESVSKTDSYPLAEFGDYIRSNPSNSDMARSILEYFNLRWHAQSITANTLIMADHEDGIYSTETLSDLKELIPGEITLHGSERSSFKDGLFAENWITSEMFGKEVSPIVPEHWR
ncbi:MAG: acetylxylan esterase [Chloroflexota bacterium]|nr:acetylxylan esterase [Chloroflexota bacterium]